MSNKMLIDATHPEETRVVVLRGNRVEEFDFEAADRQQLRGNIYLAKVTRVEPSLQAAFVEYGGNRHGFLAFSEIHPDYYQIPFADRQVLLQEQAREEEEEAAEEAAAERSEEAAAERSEEAAAERSQDGAAFERSEEVAAEGGEPAMAEKAEAGPAVSEDAASADQNMAAADSDNAPGEADGITEHHEAEHVESVGAEDALEELPERRKPRPRQYKIQEVIKRRQVLLVQVVKEERGNKGAALTTYLSLAGRYSVLMPNTGRGGGISRKITNPADRKRLKAIASELDVPEGMGVILRTAGANRTKTEVKRDFEYLLRLWENVRELTLKSSAPKLVYEEGSLIKRSIRDLYSREIEQVVVAGDEAYREAKDFMRMLMPSHARNVQQYRDDAPIFARNGVEAQLDAMFSPQVTLRSGGYIVINQTEALVSIDVNSGRSTREHSIEDTALNTNLEAAEEIARQLRLRDLAGLIVIDFIDMEENRNNRAVERKLKDCLRADRARIQVGRISHFGLMEMSRQRIRTGVLESSTVLCPHCRGTGQVRSISSLSLQILRAIEDTLLRHGSHHLHVSTRPEVALYVLNQKRRHLAQLEARFGLSITVIAESPENGAGFMVERGAPVEDRPERDNVVPIAAMQNMQEPSEPEFEEGPELVAEEAEAEGAEPERAAAGQERDRPRRRRRRRGNGDDRHDRHQGARLAETDADRETESDVDSDSDVEEIGGGESRTASEGDDEAAQDARRRRRGRRGGRRRGRTRENGEQGSHERPALEGSSSEAEFAPADVSFADGELQAGGAEQPYHQGNEQPRDEPYEQDSAQPYDAPAVSAAEKDDRDRPLTQPTDGDSHAPEIAVLTEAVQGRGEQASADLLASAAEREDGSQPMADGAEPPRSDGETAPQQDAIPDRNPASEPAADVVVAPEVIEDDRPKRSGWWNRRSFF